ncbi:myb-related protein B-like [Salarias fasciatus]|uniref:myb-related protein B-like n=1 Tax=Salarias fasciatus TaxID=181472 RepID=UPI001176C6FB|nr:myb-related protein B-like [Salarias fasciatus]
MMMMMMMMVVVVVFLLRMRSYGRKSNTECRQRWRLIKNQEVVKGPWSEEEDQKMKDLIQTYGTKHWSLIAGHLRTRNEKQCRERWYNHLNQAVVKSKWTPEEDQVLLQCQKLHGNRWATISKLLPGRSDNCVKNRWHSTLKKYVETKQDFPDTILRPLDNISIPTKAAGSSDPMMENRNVDGAGQLLSSTDFSKHARSVFRRQSRPRGRTSSEPCPGSVCVVRPSLSTQRG